MYHLTFLGKAGSINKDCPTLYATDHGSFVIQGWRTDHPGIIEIPHALLGFVEQGSYIGAVLSDTGRGTFTLSGPVMTDPETLGRLELAEDEMVIEVPALERTFFGAAAAR